MLLNCSRSWVCRIQEEMSSTYTAKMCIRGMVIHMLRGREMCTDGAVIHKVNVTISPLLSAYDTTCDSYWTFGVTISPPFVLTIRCTTHTRLSDCWLLYAYFPLRYFLMAVAFYVQILTQPWRVLCTCISSLWSCFLDLHVYKRPTVRHRNSKQVLFCTNTSRRRTCLSFILWTTILGEYPTTKLLSPEWLPCDCDLVIRVMTTRNIRTADSFMLTFLLHYFLMAVAFYIQTLTQP